MNICVVCSVPTVPTQQAHGLLLVYLDTPVTFPLRLHVCLCANECGRARKGTNVSWQMYYSVCWLVDKFH